MMIRVMHERGSAGNLEGKTRQGNPVVEADDGWWSPIYTMKNEVVVDSCKA